jgi:hypothetical protein
LGVNSFVSLGYEASWSAKYSFQMVYGQIILSVRFMGLNAKAPVFSRGFFDLCIHYSWLSGTHMPRGCGLI